MELHIFAQNFKVIAVLLTIQNQVIFSCIYDYWLGLKSYMWFQNWTGMQHEFELNDFRPKLHNTKFNYQLIKLIVKSFL